MIFPAKIDSSMIITVIVGSELVEYRAYLWDEDYAENS